MNKYLKWIDGMQKVLLELSQNYGGPEGQNTITHYSISQNTAFQEAQHNCRKHINISGSTIFQEVQFFRKYNYISGSTITFQEAH